MDRVQFKNKQSLLTTLAYQLQMHEQQLKKTTLSQLYVVFRVPGPGRRVSSTKYSISETIEMLARGKEQTLGDLVDGPIDDAISLSVHVRKQNGK